MEDIGKILIGNIGIITGATLLIILAICPEFKTTRFTAAPLDAGIIVRIAPWILRKSVKQSSYCAIIN